MSYLVLRYCCECGFDDKGLSRGCCCWCHEPDTDQPTGSTYSTIISMVEWKHKKEIKSEGIHLHPKQQ